MNKKKCIVLDLDNTLWGGVIGEDGMDGLALSLSSPGSGFMAFQQALLDHYHRGIILAINSRNNPEDAWQVIRNHPNMILKEQHFAATRMNWNNKADNLRELAGELNIGLDSMVFLDDDPTNRALVRAMLPEVETPDLPIDPADYARFLNALPYFESDALTDEDKMRGNLYVTERLRREEEKNYTNKEDFFNSLGLELSVFEDDDSSLSRLAQLTEKTNQFNVLKHAFSEAEIQAFIADSRYGVFHARLQDKFGDHGIIAFALVRKEDNEWRLESLLMSCRVFGREVEHAFVGAISRRAAQEGIQALTVAFEESEKNAPAREFVQAHFTERSIAPSLQPYMPSWIKTII